MRVSGVFKFNSKIILLSTIILKSAITICYTTKPCQQVDVLCVWLEWTVSLQSPFFHLLFVFKFCLLPQTFLEGGREDKLCVSHNFRPPSCTSEPIKYSFRYDSVCA